MQAELHDFWLPVTGTVEAKLHNRVGSVIVIILMN